MNISETLYALVCFLRRGHQSGNTTLALSGMLNASPAPGREWAAPRLVYLSEALARSTERHTGIPCMSLASPSSVLLAKPGPVLFDSFTVEELAEKALQRIDGLESQLEVSRRAQAEAARARSLLAPLTELRDALVESMGTEGGIPMTDRLAAALEICGVEAKREAVSPTVVEVPKVALTDKQIEMAEQCCDEDDYPPFEEWALNGRLAELADIVATLYRGARLVPSPPQATKGPVVEVPDVAIPMGTALQRLGAHLAELLEADTWNNLEANYLIPAIHELETASQPSSDAVVVSREEWECIQRIVKAGRNWLTDSKENAVEDLSFELTALGWIRNPAQAETEKEAPHA